MNRPMVCAGKTEDLEEHQDDCNGLEHVVLLVATALWRESAYGSAQRWAFTGSPAAVRPGQVVSP